MRNNKNELGLLRSYIYCGICGKRMHVVYPSPAGLRNRNTPLYRCETPYGKNTGTISFHRTQIHMKLIDELAKKKIVEVLLHPEQVRLQVEEWRKENREVIDPTDIEEAVAKITKALDNLYKLAENAPDDEELARITTRMKELGKQKREAEAMLYNLEEDKEEREVIESELVRFEKWVEKVRPFLSDPAYLAEAEYDELRSAIHILGLKTTIYPTQGEWPFRHNIEVTIPEVKKAIEGQSKT
jgi:hypothetical protein